MRGRQGRLGKTFTLHEQGKRGCQVPIRDKGSLHAVTTHLHCPKWAGLERGPGARRGHNVESELEKEQEQIGGSGSHLGQGDVDDQEMLPRQLLCQSP